MYRPVKKKRSFRRSVDLNRVYQAIDELTRGGISYRKVAEKYGISIATLMKYRKLIAADENNKGTLTRSSNYNLRSVFSEQEEDMFVENLLAIADCDILLNDSLLKQFVQAYIKSQDRTIDNFTNGTLPSSEWINNFKKRNCKQLPTCVWDINASSSAKLHSCFSDLDNIYNDEQ